MTAIIFSFLKDHWLGALVGAFAIGIVAKLSLEQMEINHLHNRIALCSAENITLEHSNKALVTSVENQNAAIFALQAEADRKMKAAARALVAAKANARKYALAARQIKAQRTTGNECADMRSLVDNYIRDAR